jgi:hypothetical protein
VDATHHVDRRAVDAAQLCGLGDVIDWLGDPHRPAFEDLLDEQPDGLGHFVGGYLRGADVALRLGVDVPVLPRCPGSLHRVDDAVGGAGTHRESAICVGRPRRGCSAEPSI